VATPDGTKILRKSVKGNINEVEDLGAKLAQHLIKIGANDLINND
jgi:porphobilinogen deaminase